MFTVRRKRVKLLRRRLQAEKARNRTKSQRTSCDIVRTGTHAQSPLQTSNAISAVTGPEGRDEHIVDRCGPLTDGRSCVSCVLSRENVVFVQSITQSK